MADYLAGKSFRATFIIVVPMVLAYYLLGLNHWDMSVPLIYVGSDDVWQLILTKVLKDTGWVLYNPYLGAPDIASWHHNAAAQTSALHSVLMLIVSPLFDDAVRLQQVYYFLNFPLICVTSFIASRLLGINRLASFCIGMLFAFTSFRINYLFYAFISNYFTIPLAVVVVAYISLGRFNLHFMQVESNNTNKFTLLFKDKYFLLCVLFAFLTALSDGYYAFFTLLLLGFSLGARVLLGDWREPKKLIPGVMLIFVVLITSLLLQLPLSSYKKTHHDEFYPGGIIDSSLIKHPFEAEVYSTSLKMMIAPIAQNRVQFLSDVGQKMIKSNDEARAFKNYQALVPLGTFGSLLLGLGLVVILVPAFKKVLDSRQANYSRDRQALGDSLLSIGLFIFVCSIFGGVGTLIAFVFPTIRAYDRFPIFLLFVLYLGAGLVASIAIESSTVRRKAVLRAIVVIVTCLALYDQTPKDSFKGKEPIAAKFLAERSFVHSLESVLPSGAMVYQYPYSQYLRDSKYYGWGSFAHVRLYLHSNTIRWSNGGAKNSSADDWGFRSSKLPFIQLLAEIEALGFKALVIDRTVVKEDEYSVIRKQLADLGYAVTEDKASDLSAVVLRDPGYLVTYDEKYLNIESLVLTSKTLSDNNVFPELLNAQGLRAFVANFNGVLPAKIASSVHPQLFVDSSVIYKGSGDAPVVPYTDMVGSLGCSFDSGSNAVANKTLSLTLSNKSFFRWSLGSGSFPINIGYHIETDDGQLVVWDNGYRVPLTGYIDPGESKTIQISLQSIRLPGDKPLANSQHVRFALVQDASAWFSEISCVVKD
ncbi:hypothetical protein [Pseudomonas fluorescens]|uniref:hypothetical protein n=1 Tax=Pseudomonas fluorescens TaxID=294 RepID=UPI0005EB6C8C|nr:hypothetical protein [Pseudomonas fluorescens]